MRELFRERNMLVRRALQIAAALCACGVTGAFADPGKPAQQVSSCYDLPAGTEKGFIADMAGGRPLPDEALVELRSAYASTRAQLDCQWFDYTVDGLVVQGFMLRPRDTSKGPLPVVIFNRGGSARDPVVFRYLLGKLAPLAERGFIVMGSQYRGAVIPDHDNAPPVSDEFGGKEVEDVLALLPIIDATPGADPSRIGIWGSSRGGMMAYLAAKKTARFRAMVAESTPTDLAYELQRRPAMEKVLEEYIPQYLARRDTALRERSAVAWANEINLSTEILILHGARDQAVSAISALHMAEELQKLGHPYKLVIYERGAHGMPEDELEVQSEIGRWFEEKLVSERPIEGRDTSAGVKRNGP